MEQPVRKRFDYSEIYEVMAALDEQELWPYAPSAPEELKRNRWMAARRMLEGEMSEKAGRKIFAIPASSGTAAVHIGLGGLKVPAGSEVILPAMTDMGSASPVIFQNLIPVFADLDPETGLLTADTISRAITERTGAVIVVHLAGSPADMDPIMELCRPKGIKVIEDAAQAHGATYKGRPVGTLGDAGAFSLNGQKQITTGEGGLVFVDDVETFKRCLNFSDKHRRRVPPETPEHDIYAGAGLSYRMSDVDFSMLLAQWKKLPEIAARFTAVGRRLDERLSAIPGVSPMKHHPDAVPTFFTYLYRLNGAALEKKDAVKAAVDEAAKRVAMRSRGPYGQKPLYAFPVFQNRNFFPSADGEAQIWPAELVAQKRFPGLEPYDYSKVSLANTQAWYETSLSLSFHDGHSPEHADVIADAIASAI